MADEASTIRTPSTYGPGEGTDDTRQAQQAMANDMPVDVNFNAIVARSQALTIEQAGRAFTANADRREKMFDQFAVSEMKKA